MQQITLSQVLPEVFRERTDLVSEVWRQELSLERGKHYLIEASSGAGKSSFCSFVYGWRGDYSGRIAFDGQDIRELSASAWGRIRRESLSFLFQDMRLFGELTAWDNVWIKNQLTGHKDRQTIEGYFEALGIADKLKSPARLLSLGQQQTEWFAQQSAPVVGSSVRPERGQFQVDLRAGPGGRGGFVVPGAQL